MSQGLLYRRVIILILALISRQELDGGGEESAAGVDCRDRHGTWTSARRFGASAAVNLCGTAYLLAVSVIGDRVSREEI